MQMDAAAKLREVWDRKGNPPCAHPRVDKEYHLGADTGDVACTTCGETWPRSDRAQRPSAPRRRAAPQMASTPRSQARKRPAITAE